MVYINIDEKYFDKHRKEMEEEADEKGDATYTDDVVGKIDEIEGKELHISAETELGFISVDVEIGLEEMVEILKYYIEKLEEIQGVINTKI